MAGELPVALVHAAGVLQVFVSVVLIGKHLPTSVTLEALASIWRRNTFGNCAGWILKDAPSGGWILTLGGKKRVALLSAVLQGEGDAEELHVAVAVPHQQLLARLDVFAGVVEDLGLHLHGDQVLLVREPGAFHQRHPVPRTRSAVNEMAQLAVFEHLKSGRVSLEGGEVVPGLQSRWWSITSHMRVLSS